MQAATVPAVTGRACENQAPRARTDRGAIMSMAAEPASAKASRYSRFITGRCLRTSA